MDQAPEAGRRNFFGAIPWVCFFFLIIYPLSIGPAARICARYDMPRRHPRTEKVLEAIYAPMALLVENSPPASRFVMWYLRDIWRVPET